MNTGLLQQTYTEKLWNGAVTALKQNIVPILGGLICGLLAYMYAFTNNLVNMDNLEYLFSKGATYESGRWGLALLSVLFPDYSMSWIYGILSLMLLTAAACVCIRLLSIRNRALQFLLAGATVTFPSQIATITYYYTAAPYGIAFLMSVLAVRYVRRGDRKGYLSALVLSVLSSGIYQAYISITAAMLVVALIRDVITAEEDTKRLLQKGFAYVGFLVLALGSYWLITKAVWYATGIGIGSYANVALQFRVADIPKNIGKAYVYFYRILFRSHQLVITGVQTFLAHYFMLIFIGIELILWAFANRKPGRILLLLFLVAILPLAINCMYLFTSERMVHLLMLYAFVALYYLAAVVLESGQFARYVREGLKKYRVLLYDIVLWCIAVILVSNIYFANRAYLNLQLQYERTYHFTSSLLTTLQNTPGYTGDAKVALVELGGSRMFLQEEFLDLNPIYGLRGMTPNTYSVEKLFAYYNGVEITLVEGEELERIRALPEVEAMAPYPGHGCVKRIDGIFVVKLS